ncbi:MAG: alanine racemase, partial [Proteobacteria bacterium]|nr:alanine racemase [Pseudomonadota bacterium]
MQDAAPSTLLDDHTRPNRFEVDLGAIAQFTRNIRGLVGRDATVFAALKCNAYGFGLLPVARTVLASGADAIAVVDRADAIALRQAGIGAPLLVYPGGVATPAAVAACAAHDLIPTLIDLESAALYSRLTPRRLDVAIKIDIGQERLGFAADAAVEAITAIAAMPNLRVRIVNSHPNVPEPPSRDYLEWQLGRFEAICGALAGRGIDVPIRMVASSKILSVLGRLAFNAVDPGQMYFGAFRAAGDVPWLTQRQAFRKLSSRLIHVRVLVRDAFLAEAPFPVRPGLRMGVIPIGTSDGVGRLHAGAALVRGRRAPVLGGPSLEHMRLDLTEIPEAAVGDEVVLIGEQGAAAITPDAVVA